MSATICKSLGTSFTGRSNVRYSVYLQSVLKIIILDLCADTQVVVTMYYILKILCQLTLQHVPLLLSICLSTTTKTMFYLPLCCLSDE